MASKQLKLFSEPRVFGLYSPVMGSGKSEVAKVLVNEYGAKLVKFAGPLKDMTRVLLLHMGVHPTLVDQCLEGKLKEAPVPGWGHGIGGHNAPPEITPRRIMQTLGTEWRDLIARDLWSKIAVENIKEQLVKGHHVVVDDMRFYHEMQVISELGGVTIRIDRPTAKLGLTTHSSEGALDGYEFGHSILNNSTLTDLRQAVVTIMKEYIR